MKTLEVLNDIEQMGATLVAIRVPNTKPSTRTGFWPDYLYDFMDHGNWMDAELRFPAPNQKSIDHMDRVLNAMIPLVHETLDRRIVLARSLRNPFTWRPYASWRCIAKKLGCSHEFARQRFESAIIEIAWKSHIREVL